MVKYINSTRVARNFKLHNIAPKAKIDVAKNQNETIEKIICLFQLIFANNCCSG